MQPVAQAQRDSPQEGRLRLRQGLLNDQQHTVAHIQGKLHQRGPRAGRAAGRTDHFDGRRGPRRFVGHDHPVDVVIGHEFLLIEPARI